MFTAGKNIPIEEWNTFRTPCVSDVTQSWLIGTENRLLLTWQSRFLYNQDRGCIVSGSFDSPPPEEVKWLEISASKSESYRRALAMR